MLLESMSFKQKIKELKVVKHILVIELNLTKQDKEKEMVTEYQKKKFDFNQ